MLGPMSDSLLVRLLFAIANFTSTELMERMGVEPDEWNIVMLSIGFVAGRSSYIHLMAQWTPRTADAAVSKDIMATFLDANWTVFMYVVVQWGIDLMEEWWRRSESVVVAVVVTEIPILVMQAIVIAVAVTDFGHAKQNAASMETARNIMGQLNFSISFFIAERANGTIDMTPDPFVFTLAAVVFVAWYVSWQRVFALWVVDAERDEAEASLKTIFEQNITTLNTAAVLIITSMFVNIFHNWWLEGEHWIVALSLFMSVLFLVLGIAAWFKENATDKKAVPDYMINRAIFSMAMFLANKAHSSGGFVDVEKTVWKIFWSVLVFMAFHVVVQQAMQQWARIIAVRERRLRGLLLLGDTPQQRLQAQKLGFRRHHRLATMLMGVRGERVLQNAVQKNVQTWITIITIFLTRWLVNIFVQFWRDEGDWVVSIAVVETSMLLLVALVKLSEWYEGVYADFASRDPSRYGIE